MAKADGADWFGSRKRNSGLLRFLRQQQQPDPGSSSTRMHELLKRELVTVGFT